MARTLASVMRVDFGAAAALYRIVEEYASLGDHRTGTAVDVATTEWFASALEDRGADVTTHAYDFDAYQATTTVTADGRNLDALPLYYSAVGSTVCDTATVLELEFLGGIIPGDVDALVADAVSDKTVPGEQVVVVATRGHGDRLVALNRTPQQRGDVPVVLVAGAECERLSRVPVSVRWDASLVSAISRNVIGRFGPATDDPVLIVTPLSGWFRCAGERGTGIALALELAGELSRELSVVVAGTTGHELEYLGQRRLQSELTARVPRPRAAVHLGAGAGAGEPDENGVLRPGALRLAMVDGVSSTTTGALVDALGGSGFDVGPGPATWPGEGEALRSMGAPTLSLISAFDRIHTSDDVPEFATSPALLSQTYEDVAAAVRSLLP